MFELIANALFWVKLMILIVFAGYVVFAVVTLNQVRTMAQIIDLPSTKIVLSVITLMIVSAISLFILSIVVL